MIDKNEILDYLKTMKPNLVSSGIKTIGIFGSYAKDSATETSDIDIVYESTDEFLANFKGWNAFVYLDENLRNKLAQKFHKKIDLFDLNSNASIKEFVKKEAIYV